MDDASVRTPQPVNISGESRCSATCAALSSSMMPVHRQWPMLDVSASTWSQGPKNRGATGKARQIKLAHHALWMNPETLTTRQRGQLDWVAKADRRLSRVSCLLKEGLRHAFSLLGDQGSYRQVERLARRSRLPAFVTLQRNIVDHATPSNPP